jgi:hypothetical protein
MNARLSTRPHRNRLSAARTQRLLGLLFLSLGAGCLLAPMQVATLVLRPGSFGDSATSALVLGGFGTQAVLVGIALLCARFNARGFLWFGFAAMLLFLAFDAWASPLQPLSTGGLWLGAAGSTAIVALSLHGARQAAHEHRRSRRYILARLATITASDERA